MLLLFPHTPFYSHLDMTDRFSLPGIQAIAYLAALTLPENLCMQSLAGVPVHIMADMNNVPFNGEPLCECTQTNAQGGSSQSVEFSFRSTSELPSEFHLAFVVIDANGNYFLIGTKEEHPQIERVQSFGTPDGDPNTFSYTVSLIAPRALIPCRVV